MLSKRSYVKMMHSTSVLQLSARLHVFFFKFFDKHWLERFTNTLKGKNYFTILDLLTLLVAGDKKSELCIYTPQPERGTSTGCREAQTVF